LRTNLNSGILPALGLESRLGHESQIGQDAGA